MSDVLVPPPVLDATLNADNLEAAFVAAGPLGGVVLDDGEYVFNRPLVLGAQAGDIRQWAVSLRGHGPMRSKLKYVGPPDQSALLVSHEKFTRLEDFSLSGPGKGIGTGLEIGRAGGPYNGTMSNGLILKHVSVGRFGIGWRLGHGSTACSELIFESCEANHCATGFFAESYNTLNLVFFGPRFNFCDTGVATNAAGQIAVYGGAGSGNGLTFNLLTGGQFSIRDFRDESAYFGNFAGTTAWTSVVLDNCRVLGRKLDVAGKALPAVTTGWGAELLVQGGQYNGPIRIGAQHAQFGGVTMLRAAVNDTEPFRVGGGRDSWSYPYQVLGCARVDAGGNSHVRFLDEVGTIVGGVRKAGWQVDADGLLRVSGLRLGPNNVLRELNGRLELQFGDGSSLAFGAY